MRAVLETDGQCGKFFLGQFEAGDADAVKVAYRLQMPAAEHLDPAGPAEEVADVAAAERIFAERAFACLQREVRGRHDRLPETLAQADRAVAAAGALRRVEPDREAHSPAMTGTIDLSLHHDLL